MEYLEKECGVEAGFDDDEGICGKRWGFQTLISLENFEDFKL